MADFYDRLAEWQSLAQSATAAWQPLHRLFLVLVVDSSWNPCLPGQNQLRPCPAGHGTSDLVTSEFISSLGPKLRALTLLQSVAASIQST